MFFKNFSDYVAEYIRVAVKVEYLIEVNAENAIAEFRQKDIKKSKKVKKGIHQADQENMGRNNR